MVLAEQKKKVQDNFRSKLGLIVDKPKAQGAGNTIDGNTARRAFKNPEILAECLGLDSELLQQMKTILIAISIHLPIDPLKFQTLCDRAAERYVSLYKWYPMPSTLHKFLIHGGDILSTSVLPVGVLAEEASEARNKDYKNFRLNHSRKLNRESNISDVFLRCMDTSDVKISSIALNMRQKQKKLETIPKSVRALIFMPEIESNESKFEELTENNEDNEDETDNTGLSETFRLLDDIVLSDDDEEEEDN